MSTKMQRQKEQVLAAEARRSSSEEGGEPPKQAEKSEQPLFGLNIDGLKRGRSTRQTKRTLKEYAAKGDDQSKNLQSARSVSSVSSSKYPSTSSVFSNKPTSTASKVPASKSGRLEPPAQIVKPIPSFKDFNQLRTSSVNLDNLMRGRSKRKPDLGKAFKNISPIRSGSHAESSNAQRTRIGSQVPNIPEFSLEETGSLSSTLLPRDESHHLDTVTQGDDNAFETDTNVLIPPTQPDPIAEEDEEESEPDTPVEEEKAAEERAEESATHSESHEPTTPRTVYTQQAVTTPENTEAPPDEELLNTPSGSLPSASRRSGGLQLSGLPLSGSRDTVTDEPVRSISPAPPPDGSDSFDELSKQQTNLQASSSRTNSRKRSSTSEDSAPPAKRAPSTSSYLTEFLNFAQKQTTDSAPPVTSPQEPPRRRSSRLPSDSDQSSIQETAPDKRRSSRAHKSALAAIRQSPRVVSIEPITAKSPLRVTSIQPITGGSPRGVSSIQSVTGGSPPLVRSIQSTAGGSPLGGSSTKQAGNRSPSKSSIGASGGEEESGGQTLSRRRSARRSANQRRSSHSSVESDTSVKNKSTRRQSGGKRQADAEVSEHMDYQEVMTPDEDAQHLTEEAQREADSQHQAEEAQREEDDGNVADESDVDDQNEADDVIPETQTASRSRLSGDGTVVIPETQHEIDDPADLEPVDAANPDGEEDGESPPGDAPDARDTRRRSKAAERTVQFDPDLLSPETPQVGLINTPMIPKSGPSHLRRGLRLTGEFVPPQPAAEDEEEGEGEQEAREGAQKKVKAPRGKPVPAYLWIGKDGVNRGAKDIMADDVLLDVFEQEVCNFRERVTDPVVKKAINIVASRTQKHLRAQIERKSDIQKLNKSTNAAERRLIKRQRELLQLKQARRELRRHLGELEDERREANRIKRLTVIDEWLGKFKDLNLAIKEKIKTKGGKKLSEKDYVTYTSQ